MADCQNQFSNCHISETMQLTRSVLSPFEPERLSLSNDAIFLFQNASASKRQPRRSPEEHPRSGQHKQTILPPPRERHVPVPAAVRARPENGHAAARRRRLGREAFEADGQVRGVDLGVARRPAVRNAGVPAGAGAVRQEG